MRGQRTATDSAQAPGTGVGRHRATAKIGARRRGSLALACLSLLVLAGLFSATSIMGAFTHPFISEFTGADTPAGSLGPPADKVAVRQSNGNVSVIDRNHGVVATFSGSGAFLSQIEGFGSFGGSDPDLAVDNSATASEGNLYVLPEFGSLSAYNSSGTLLYQLDGSTTPAGSWGSDVCGTAVDSGGNVYVSDFSRSLIYKFDSSGTYLATFTLSFSPCDIAIDTDGTMYVIHWNNALHKLAPDGTDLGIIDGESPKAVGVDLVSHHVFTAHDTFVREFDASGTLLSQFGATRLANARGVDINGSTGNVYVTSNPPAGGRVLIFGPLAVVTEVLTLDATNVTGTSATLNGNVDPADAGDVTECHFEYGTDTSYGTSVPCVPAPPYAGPTNVSADISGLAESTTYHFALVVTSNSRGTVNGGDKTFQTPGPPIVVSQSATNVTDTSATLNATVNPNGGDTTCVFQYVDDTAFQASGYSTATSVDCSPFNLGSSFNPQNTSADVTGLTPNTLYHFRVVATNPAGPTTGDDTTFHTFLSFLIFLDSFGSSGSGSGQFQAPVGVAVDDRGGKVYVADSANARIQKFDATGTFIAAWGWGVADGAAQSEVCTANCQAGIPGSGAGQFSNPTSVAVDNSKSRSKGSVYVGDAGTNVIQKFSSNGKYVATIDGSTAPQGAFQSLAGVALDQNGHLWAADGGTLNVIEFDAQGNFLQQWTSPTSSIQAIVVDATHGAVYLLAFGTTERFTLTGGDRTTIDPASGTALALDPQTGNLYVDHGKDVAIYDSTGARVDTLFSLASGTSSQGLAYYPTVQGKSAGKNDRLFVSDVATNQVAIYGPPGQGAPIVTAQSTAGAGKTGKILKATIVPLGHKTTCTFQYVTSADFDTSGYTNATTVPCTPAGLGSSFTYQQASATISGLTVGTFYHFRVVATNSAGTTFGADQTFQAGPGAWTPFSRCAVDDPAMLATDGINTISFCLASNSPNGSITLGNTTTATGNSNLQGGLVVSLANQTFTFIAPPGGSLIGDPVQVDVVGILVNATVQSAGTPTDFDLFAGLSLGVPIITLPVKIHLEGVTADLGPSCFIGSDQNPIVLHPANTDLSNVELLFGQFDPDGTPNPNGILAFLTVAGTVQGDSTFSVPGASGCGPNGDGSLDAAINAVVGLPSPSGANNLVLNDASSSLALPASGLSGQGVIVTGQEFADFWHLAFD